MTTAAKGGKPYRCSFCGKSQDQVRKLIAGQGVYICDECINLCQEIIEEEMLETPRPKQAASMAAVLLAAGRKGKRYALPNSRIMIHQGSGGFRGAPQDALIQMKEWETLVALNHQILARHTGQPLEKVTADTERDRFMGPDEAKDYGIIDAVYNLQGSSLIAQAHDAGLSGGEGSSVTEPEEAGTPEPEQQKKSKS